MWAGAFGWGAWSTDCMVTVEGREAKKTGMCIGRFRKNNSSVLT